MVDFIVFSKDRPLQLYNHLESIVKFIKGEYKVTVMFAYSNEEYYKSYCVLNSLPIFQNIYFVDETSYGFYQTLYSLFDTISSEFIIFAIDDEIYCDEFEPNKHVELFSKYETGRINFTADYKVYDPSFYEDKGEYLVVDRVKVNEYPDSNEKLCVWYPFNVSSTIHKKSDVVELLKRNEIRNPFELEWKGSSSEIFTKYKHNILLKSEGPIIRQLHINNFLNRYEEYYNTEELHSLFKSGKVFDIDYSIVKNSKQNVDWLKLGDKSRSFPIFPWDVDPKDYEKVLKSYKTIK